MKGEQTEVFSVTRPSAQIVVFPIERQAAYIEQVVRQLDRRTGRLAQKYWNAECNRLYARMQVAGVKPEVIEAELAHLAFIVQQKRRARMGAAVRHE